MRRLRRALRTKPGDDGFTVIEFTMAVGIIVVVMASMLFTTLAGFRGIAAARRRQAGNALANQAVEQVRALRFLDLQNGLGQSDLAGTTDSAIDKSGSPSVYKYAGEQIPFSTITGGPTPLVPHQHTVTKGNLTYTVSTYLTYYLNNLTSNAFRLTVVVTWPPFRGGTGQVSVQTILYSPTCGSTVSNGGATGLHPFAAPCQPFLYGSASRQAGQINMSNADPNVPLDYGALWLPARASQTQSEQVQAVSGTAQTSGVSLKLKSDTIETVSNRQQAASSATNDPGQPNAPVYQTASTSAQTNANLTARWGNDNSTQVTVSAGSGDTAATMSTVQALTGTNPCPLVTPTSSFDLNQNDSQPCGSSKGIQGGTLTGSLSVQPTEGTTLNTTLASSASPPTISGAFTNLDKAPEATVCTATSGDGCIESLTYRSLGTVTLIQPPVGSSLVPSSLLPGYDSSKGMVQLTSYSDSVTAEAGVGAAAPTDNLSGTITYYNGSGYSTMPVTSTPTQIPFGLQGQGVDVGNSLGVEIHVTGNLFTGGASVNDPKPAGCNSTCTRTQASATVKSPIVGSFTYTISYLGTVLASMTTSVDLGTQSAQSTYKAAPSAAQ